MVQEYNSFSIPVGTIIKDARQKKKLTQRQVAEQTGITERTLYEYEMGRTTLKDIHKREMLASVLGIEREYLGLASQTDFTHEKATSFLDNAWFSLANGNFEAAYNISSILTRNLARQWNQGDRHLLEPLARAEYLAGHSASIVSKDVDVRESQDHFQHMEYYARSLKDPTLLCIALTYQGEMLRREGKIAEAITTIEAAPQTPDVDVMARGNRAQLLARAYASQKDESSFTMKMKRAEELAFQDRKRTNPIYIAYNPCAVYEEYARLYAQRGDVKKSFRYLELVEKHMPSARRWQIPVLFTKGETLIRAVIKAEARYPHNIKHEKDYQEGMQLIERALMLAQQCGHRRQLRRAEKLRLTFGRQASKFHIVGDDLGERLSRLQLSDMADAYW